MRIPTVEKFLFCINLELGVKVVGWICAVFAGLCLFIGITGFGIAVSNYSSLVNMTAGNNEVFREVFHNSRWSKFIILVALSELMLESRLKC